MIIREIRHSDGTIDQRYNLELEWTGKMKPQFVVRFCGVWVGSAELKKDVIDIAKKHKEQGLA